MRAIDSALVYSFIWTSSVNDEKYRKQFGLMQWNCNFYSRHSLLFFTNFTGTDTHHPMPNSLFINFSISFHLSPNRTRIQLQSQPEQTKYYFAWSVRRVFYSLLKIIGFCLFVDWREKNARHATHRNEFKRFREHPALIVSLDFVFWLIAVFPFATNKSTEDQSESSNLLRQ